MHQINGWPQRLMPIGIAAAALLPTMHAAALLAQSYAVWGVSCDRE